MPIAVPLHVALVLYSDELPRACIEDCSAPGQPADEAVTYWRQHLAFTVDRDNATRCLAGYGAWNRAELAEMQDEAIAEKILWLACGNFREGATIFCLE